MNSVLKFKVSIGKKSIIPLLMLIAACDQDTRTQQAAQSPETETPVINTVYATPKHAPAVGAMYPRVVKLQHAPGAQGYLLATFEHYMNREPSFPIYRSTDNGETWQLLSEVEDVKNNHGMKYQPHLFELPQQVGEFPAGTIYCSGNSIPEDLGSTELLVYVSHDGGASWEYLSSIVEGGRAIYPNEGETPVWEPFLALDAQGRLVAYYSDERYYDDGYSQLLAHKVSEDGGKTWGEVVFDVAVNDNKTRPGMSIVSKLPNGKFLLIFEIVGVEGIPVHYKLSDDGLDWGDPADLGTRILSKEGYFLKSTPFVIWSPYGGENGTLIASGMATNQQGTLVGNGFMTNHKLGEDEWTYIETPIHYETGEGNPPGGYSQSMITTDQEGREILQVVPVPNGNANHMDIKAAKFDLPD